MTKAGPCIGAVIELQTDMTDRQIFGGDKDVGLCSNVCDEVGLIRESRHQVANKRIDRQTERQTDFWGGAWGGWLETRVYALVM